MSYLDTYFLPYQRAWINDDSRKKIMEKSRRTGITHAQAYEDVRDCVQKKVPKVWFSSADESAAKEYIEDAARFAKIFNVGAEMMGEKVLDETKGIKALQLDLSNGTKIHALTSNPKAFRSKGGKVVLDEFAFHDDAKAMWKAAKPAITWGFPVRIISTHNGVNSYYNEWFIKRMKEGELNGWHHHKVDIQKALDQGLLDKILGKETTPEERDAWLESEREDMTEEDFAEEYMCIPQDEKSAFLSYEMLAGVEDTNVLWAGETIPQHSTGPLYLGKDIARSEHFSVKWLVEKVGPILFTRKVIVEHKMRFRDQQETLYDILQHPAFRRACIDQTGIGMMLAEEAIIDFGQYRVEGVTFTGPSKEQLAYGLRTKIDKKEIILPSQPDIRKDLHSVKKIVTPHGNIRFDQDSMSRKNTDGHGDRFWAAALAVEAAKNYSGDVTVKSRRRRDSDRMLQGYE